MTKVTFSLAQIRAMNRPAEYEAELAACAVARTETEMTFDADGPCYRALLTKYRGDVSIAAPAPNLPPPSPRRPCRCGGRAVGG